ncbi:MAG: DUF2950 domain-containing protein [Planctomycetota bacterium]|jgi:hypothetical protein
MKKTSQYAILTLPLFSLVTACGSTQEQAAPAPEPQVSQMTFESPEVAMALLLAAARADDTETIRKIFGPEHIEQLSSGDPAQERLARQEFCANADEMTVLEPVGDDMVEIILGRDGWPAPIPIVREGEKWYFDTEEGIDEILTRRIGRNEMEAIELCRGYLDAQYIYRNRDWDGDGVREFAQRIPSTPGKFDGLYWPEEEAGEMPVCPLNDLIAENEIYFEGRETGSPWFGYYVKILKSQGSGADGGAMDYLVEGNMTGGFALVAWPAEHHKSGVMSFLVSHHGVVYEKDLGEDSAAIASAMTAFDPGDGWEVVN